MDVRQGDFVANADEKQNITRKRIRQIEAKALRKLRSEDDDADPDPVPVFSPKKPPEKKGD